MPAGGSKKAAKAAQGKSALSERASGSNVGSNKRTKSRSPTPEKVKSKKHKAGGSKGHRDKIPENAQKGDRSRSKSPQRPPSRHSVASVSPVRTRSRSRSKSLTPNRVVQFQDEPMHSQDSVLDYEDDVDLESTEVQQQLNNSASPSEDGQPDEMPMGGVLGVAVEALPKMVTMSEAQLEQLVNRSIENYEKRKLSQERNKSKSPAAKAGGGKTHQNVEGISHRMQQMGVQPVVQSGSGSTVYEHFCDPPVTPHGLPGLTDDMQRMRQLQADVESAVNAGMVETTPPTDSDTSRSDDSTAGQINTSDELNVSVAETRAGPGPSEVTEPPTEQDRAREWADRMYQDADINKIPMEAPPGKVGANVTLEAFSAPHQGIQMCPPVAGMPGRGVQPGSRHGPKPEDNIDGSLDYLHDDMSAHVDQATRLKIMNGESVELYRLLPREFEDTSEEDTIEFTTRGGRTVVVPPADKEARLISNYRKWEAAFRVFEEIYLVTHPTRAIQLVRYRNMIEDMAGTWVWDNVARYDRRHRNMMETFKNRDWCVPYDKAKQELKVMHAMRASKKVGMQTGAKAKKEVCRNFNRGKCDYGRSCKFDHKCSVCGKFGHGASTCRQRLEHSNPQLHKEEEEKAK